MADAQIPVLARVHLAHACLNWIAAAEGVDVLHVKGPALDPVLTRTGGVPRQSTDADVLVRPSQVARYMSALGRHGWTALAGFATGSVFEHASALTHEFLGHCDVHRSYPGLGLPAEATFDALWAERGTTAIAGQACPVPSVAAQRLLLVLHAGRTPGGQPTDVRIAYTEAAPTDQAAVDDLVTRFHAEVGFAAGTGRLDTVADDPEHDLWATFAQPGSRLGEWRARMKAAPTRRAALRIALRALVVNRDHLALTLGRRPTPRDLAAAYADRLARALREAWALVRGRRP